MRDKQTWVPEDSPTPGFATGGTAWVLPALDGQPLRRWDSRAVTWRDTYDTLRRPVESWSQKFATSEEPDTDTAELLYVLRTYGEDYDDVLATDPAVHRLMGQTSRIHTVKLDGPQTLQDLRYRYDAVGNALGIEDEVSDTLWGAVWGPAGPVSPDRAFVYDALDRLVQATGREHAATFDLFPGTTNQFGPAPAHPNDNGGLRTYTQAWTYDPLGNIVSMSHTHLGGSATRDYAYQLDDDDLPFNNQLVSTTRPSALDDLYEHDRHGNMTNLPGVADPRWDRFDRLASVEAAGTGEDDRWYYVYDAGGQRVRKVRATAGGDPGDRLEERRYLGAWERHEVFDSSDDVVDAWESRHVMDEQARIALVETRTVEDGDAVEVTTWRYQLDDHLGSSCVEVNEVGEILSYEAYHPYGTTAVRLAMDGAVSQKRYRYTGMERDEETGLGYHSARYYAPWLGRWASADPIGVKGGVNLWAYAAGDPVGKHDREGMAPTSEQVEVTSEVVAHLRETEKLVTETEFTIDVQVGEDTVRIRPDVAAVRVGEDGSRTLVFVETKLDPDSGWQVNQPAGLNAAASNGPFRISANESKVGGLGLTRGEFSGGVEVYVVDRSNLEAFKSGELKPLKPGEIFEKAAAQAAEAKRLARTASEAVPGHRPGPATSIATEGTTRTGALRVVGRDAAGEVASTVLRRVGKYVGPVAYGAVAVRTLDNAAEAAERGEYGSAAYQVAGLAPVIGEAQTAAEVVLGVVEGFKWWINEFSREAGARVHSLKQIGAGR